MPDLSSTPDRPLRYIPKPRPYGGRCWVELAVTLDCASPGTMAASLYWGDFKRQVFFLVLSEIDGRDPAPIAERLRAAAPGVCHPGLDPLAVIARACVVLRPRDLLKALIGEVPDGLAGVLSRLGPDPISPARFRYHALLRIFSSPEPDDRLRARVLRQIGGTLTSDQIGIVASLDPIFLHPSFVLRVPCRTTASGLTHVLAHIRRVCSSASDEAIGQSVERIGDMTISQWARRWMDRFDRLPHDHPFSGAPDFRVLDTGGAMTEAGREHRFANCLRDRTAMVALGRNLYVEYLRPDLASGLIIELRRTTAGWLLEQTHGRRNRRVRLSVALAARERLRALGIVLLDHAPGERIEMTAVGKVMDLWEFGVEDIGGGFAVNDAAFSTPQTAEEVLAELMEAAE
jgi:hypothetical protein